jgi:hypothetical protein
MDEADDGDVVMPPAGVDKQPWETPRVAVAAVKDTTDYYGYGPAAS